MTNRPKVRNPTLKNELVTNESGVTYRLREMTSASDATRLRTRGKRMLELATRAHCEQHYEFARLLTLLATEVFAHARDVEASRALCPAHVVRNGRAAALTP